MEFISHAQYYSATVIFESYIELIVRLSCFSIFNFEAYDYVELTTYYSYTIGDLINNQINRIRILQLGLPNSAVFLKGPQAHGHPPQILPMHMIRQDIS